MKIGVVVWNLSVSGGTQRQALELARTLAPSHDVAIYSYSFDPERCYPELTQGMAVKAIALTKSKKARPEPRGKLGRLWFDTYQQFHVADRQIQELAAGIDEDFDVLNVHDAFTERVAYYYRRQHPGVKVVWMSNDVPGIFQLIEHRKNQAGGGRSWKRRLVEAAQAVFYRYEAGRERRFVTPIDAVVVLDRRNQKLFREYMGKPSEIIRSGLDLERFTPKLEKTNRTFTILGTGIFFRWRRFEDLIASLAVLNKGGRKVQLNIVGSDEFDPAYGQELRAQVVESGVEDQVTFLGRVTDEELRRQYRDADAFVFPNHNQTWGLAVFEAMASGTPVVVSRTAGAHEVLSDGVNALLVPPCQPEAIAGQVERLMQNPALRKKLAENGRAFVEQNISWPNYANNMVKVFHDVTGK